MSEPPIDVYSPTKSNSAVSSPVLLFNGIEWGTLKTASRPDPLQADVGSSSELTDKTCSLSKTKVPFIYLLGYDYYETN